MPVALFHKGDWGQWVDVKRNAAESYTKLWSRERHKGPIQIFMGSSTDPYQPIEYREPITRTSLKMMMDYPPDFLFVQTRSPLLKRDIDLFKELSFPFGLSMTVETDLKQLSIPFEEEKLEAYPVSSTVNSPRNESVLRTQPL